MPDNTSLKPFHESVLDCLKKAMIFELSAYAKLLQTTIIPDNHEAIAKMARDRFNAVGWGGDAIAEHIMAQKKQKKSKARVKTSQK